MIKYFFSLIVLSLSACSSIKLPVTEQYQLTQFSHKVYQNPHGSKTLFVSPPEALRGYDNIKMHYSTQAFQVKDFAHHSWLGAPAQMIHPLVTQSLQQSGYFRAVTSGIYSDKTDYRLDSQLLMLQQNFIQEQSSLFLVMKIVLNDVKNSKVIASKILQYQIPCPANNPYGGVLAANKAVRLFTEDTVKFVAAHIQTQK
jgi:cholesterol transport system auxiliary component